MFWPIIAFHWFLLFKNVRAVHRCFVILDILLDWHADYSTFVRLYSTLWHKTLLPANDFAVGAERAASAQPQCAAVIRSRLVNAKIDKRLIGCREMRDCSG
jgi:hypothetical protein